MAGVAKIPVIDISDDNQDQAQVAKKLVEAAIEHGFIYIKNTGKDIPVEDVDTAFELVFTSLFPSLLCEKNKALMMKQIQPGQEAVQEDARGGEASMHHPKEQSRCKLKALTKRPTLYSNHTT